MKTTAKLITCGTTALFAAVLAVQAQSTTSTRQQDQQRPSPSSSSSSAVSPSTSTSGSTASDTTWREKQAQDQSKKQSTPGSTSSSVTGSTSASDRPTSGSSSSTAAGTGTQTGTSATATGTTANTQTSQSSTLNTVSTAASEAEITTVVQQIDAQGPVVVERISARFADAACNEENARKLVEALHSGGSVTLRGDDGKTATFDVNTPLGYGDAYVAMALAVEALRQAGISGCASPEQWRAVLLGGELKGGTTTTATTTTTTERFPGILVLRQQHGGWGQVAQTTNVQLGTVVAQAHSSLNIDSPTGSVPGRSGFGDDADQDPTKNPKASPRGQEKGKMKGWDKRDDDKDKDDDDMSKRNAAPGSDTENPSGKQGQPDRPPRY